MATKFFKIPFAQTGNRTPVPDLAPEENTVNYESGYSRDYERNPVTDPSAKMIEREEFNAILFDVTDALRSLQSLGFPEFISAERNGGAAFSYALNAVTTFGGKNYVSLKDNNKALPTDPLSWREFLPFHLPSASATQTQVEAGSGNNLVPAGLLRAGVTKTPMAGFALADGVVTAADTAPVAFGKTQKQINSLDSSRIKSIQAGASNVEIDNTDPLNPRISVSGSDASNAPTKDVIDAGDSVVISDSKASGALKRVAWASVTSALDASFLPSGKPLGLATKGTVVGADRVLIEDSAAALVPKVSTVQSVLNFIKTQLDPLYYFQPKGSTSQYIRGDGSLATLNAGAAGIGVVTTSANGLMIAADKTKLNGIAAGAQVNAVTSVAGRTGAVVLTKNDVGLNNVANTTPANLPMSNATKTYVDGKTSDTDAVAMRKSTIGDSDNPWTELAAPWPKAFFICVSKTTYSGDAKRQPRSLQGLNGTTWSTGMNHYFEDGSATLNTLQRGMVSYGWTDQGRTRIDAGYGRTKEDVMFIKWA